MWTICWSNNDGEDCWDRLSREQISEKLTELKNELGSLSDVLVFKPDQEVNIEEEFGIELEYDEENNG